jgi:predicted DCC family thiol-disulfide oxidoreductase YuxK
MQMKPVMFFDGGCPLCRREVAHYRRLDRADAVQWLDIAADPAPLQPLGIAPADAMRRLHVLDRDGRLQTGAWAFAAIWEVLPYYRWLARLVRLPGVLSVLDWGYRRFADWRFARRCGDGECSLR